MGHAARGRGQRHRASALGWLAIGILSASGCTPWGSTGETVEVELPDGDAPLVLGDGTTEVLGMSVERGTEVEPALEPAPAETEPLLPPTTAAPITTTVPPTTAPPPPPPTTAPPVAAAAPPPPPPVGAARALERLTRPQTRDVAARALGLIAFDWQVGLPGWELRFLDGRSGFRGLTYPESRVIEVFVRNSDTPESLAHVVAHELGHAIDVTRLDDGERSRWAATRGFGARVGWWVPSGGSDFGSGAGDFAESFAWWQAGAGHWYGQLAPPPSPLDVAVLAELTYGP